MRRKQVGCEESPVLAQVKVGMGVRVFEKQRSKSLRSKFTIKTQDDDIQTHIMRNMRICYLKTMEFFKTQ